jgi:hypothetical protein
VRGWGSSHSRCFAAAPTIAFLLRTWYLNTHARPWSSPPSRRCWCRCRGSHRSRLGFWCARLAFAFGFGFRAWRVKPTWNLRFEVDILVVTVAFAFVGGWAGALGASTRAGACACFFICDWDPRADVVTVQLEARLQLVIVVCRIVAESCTSCVRLP